MAGEVALPSDKELFDIKSWEGITERCLVPVIEKEVNNKVEVYYTINVADAMKKLVLVGDLLQLAYGSSKGFSCNVPVIKVLSRYQDLIKDSVITTTTFVEVILKALQFHKMALIMASREKCDKGLEFLVKCEEIADRMANESEKLEKMAGELSDMSEEALITATKDQTISEDEKRKIIEAAKRYKEEHAKFQSKCEDLAADIQEAAEEEKKRAASAASYEKKGLIGSIPFISIFTGKMGEKSYEAAAKEREKEDKAFQRKYELKKEKREANAELAKLVSQLNNSSVQENELQKSIMALEVAIKTMGQIKTVFLNVKQFWVGVKKHCKSLTDNSFAKELTDIPDMFVEEVKAFGYSWLALGKINIEAANAMRSVEKSVDSIMTNLPTKEEGRKLVSSLAGSILKGIEMDNEMLKDDE